MSLIVGVYVPTGIVLSGDSRTTGIKLDNAPNPTNQQQTMPVQTNIVLSDFADKIFSICHRFGVGTFGDALVNNLPIAHYVDLFEHQLGDNIPATTEELADALLEYFRNLNPTLKVGFIVIGYDQSEPYVFGIDVVQNSKNRTNVKSDGSIDYGIVRGGEADIVNRLLSQPQFNPPFNVMNIQDATDYSRHLIRSTIDQMRFEPRFATVGGEIDTLLLTSKEVRFLHKKELLCE